MEQIGKSAWFAAAASFALGHAGVKPRTLYLAGAGMSLVSFPFGLMAYGAPIVAGALASQMLRGKGRGRRR